MQQPPQMISMMPSMAPANITTEQIQKYLDENKKLILAILDNQHLGKLAECAQYQAQLQKNLMYLAAIADAQPQAPTTPQMPSHPSMQQGGFYMQHPHAAAAAAMAQQPGMFPPRMPMPFNNPHQMQEAQQLQQQAIQAQMGLRSAGVNNGLHPIHTEATLGGGSGHPAANTGPNDAHGGNKQDISEGRAAGGGGGQGSSAGGHNTCDGEPSYLRGKDDGK